MSEAEWGDLEPEMTEWEPREALLSGADGLDAIRALLAEGGRLFDRHAGDRARPVGGVLALEVGEGQASTVGGLLLEAGFASVETRADLAGVDRVVVGGWEPGS